VTPKLALVENLPQSPALASDQRLRQFEPSHPLGDAPLPVGIEPHVADATLSLDGHWAMCSCGANDYPTAELDDAKAWVCDRAELQARHRREVIENEARIALKRRALDLALADVRNQLLVRS
jgi:hypothetical protein